MGSAFGGFVTSAGESFEPTPIEDDDLASAIADEALLQQTMRCFGNADAAHAEDAGEKFVREMQSMRLGIIVGH